MKISIFWLYAFLLLNVLVGQAQSRNYNIHTIAFYNVENLFDTEDNPETFDDDRTESGKDQWDNRKYQKKIKNISRVLAEIGTDLNTEPPSIIGLCEVENLKVLEDLLAHPNLKDYEYGIIHQDSPDERGVDVALLYRKKYFRILNAQFRKLVIFEADNPSKRDYTRDQLVVSGNLNDEEFHFIVNHWPSRGGGEARSAYKREKAAILNKRIIDSIRKVDTDAKIVSMGDFNDDPNNKSFKKVLQTVGERKLLAESSLYNPMENMLREGKGSLAYRDSWNLFDQIFMSSNLVDQENNGFQFYRAGIFNKPYLITQTGQFKGYPYRTYGYSGYEGGFSDHFPVYIYLIRQVN